MRVSNRRCDVVVVAGHERVSGLSPRAQEGILTFDTACQVVVALLVCEAINESGQVASDFLTIIAGCIGKFGPVKAAAHSLLLREQAGSQSLTSFLEALLFKEHLDSSIGGKGTHHELLQIHLLGLVPGTAPVVGMTDHV